MWMISFRVNKRRVSVLLLVFVGLLLITSLLLPRQQEISASKVSGIQISLEGETIAQQTAFLKAYGWEVQLPPLQQDTVLIPNPFNDVYEQYNQLQRLQGFDLTRYRGREADRCVYRVVNYPGYGAESECIQATLLTYKGVIIGGDIASVELEGFMHGFDMQGTTAYVPLLP